MRCAIVLAAMLVIIALAPSARAEACVPGQVLIVRDGQAKTKDGTSVPLCDGDLYAVEHAEALLQDAMALAVEQARRRSDQTEHALERDGWVRALDACRAREDACESARLACERDRSPGKPPDEPGWYERASFWAGSALALTAVVVGVSTGSEHPLLWAAGGVGVGVVVGGW